MLKINLIQNPIKLVFKGVLDMEEIFIFCVSEWRTMTFSDGCDLQIKVRLTCVSNKLQECVKSYL